MFICTLVSSTCIKALPCRRRRISNRVQSSSISGLHPQFFGFLRWREGQHGGEDSQTRLVLQHTGICLCMYFCSSCLFCLFVHLFFSLLWVVILLMCSKLVSCLHFCKKTLRTALTLLHLWFWKDGKKKWHHLSNSWSFLSVGKSNAQQNSWDYLQLLSHNSSFAVWERNSTNNTFRTLLQLQQHKKSKADPPIF